MKTVKVDALALAALLDYLSPIRDLPASVRGFVESLDSSFRLQIEFCNHTRNSSLDPKRKSRHN